MNLAASYRSEAIYRRLCPNRPCSLITLFFSAYSDCFIVTEYRIYGRRSNAMALLAGLIYR